MKKYLGRLSAAVLTLLLIMIFVNPVQGNVYLSGVTSQEVQAPMLLGLVVRELSVEQAESTSTDDLLSFQAYETLSAGDSARGGVELATQELITGMRPYEVVEVLQFSLCS